MNTKSMILSRSRSMRFSRISRCVSTASTVDAQEIQQFQHFVGEWWDEFGIMKPLHSMNKLRVPLVRDGLLNTGSAKKDAVNTPTPLRELKILDVGCGGGILSEPLARLSANVTGIDANADLISLAKCHAESSSICVNYICSSIEEHSANSEGLYDAVVASEIVEHVTAKSKFLEKCLKCLKPNGSFFITTMNKTVLSEFLAIWAAENVVGLVPKGTHQIDKFIEPHKLQRLLEDHCCKTKLIHGMFYNVFTNNWHWCSDTSISYALHAIKLEDSDK